MTMSPGQRKLALTAHVTASVGWLGAVACFLALAVVGLTSQDPGTVRGAYLVMEPIARLVLVPLAFASLLTGLVQSLGTAWGLFRHCWVIFKLLINALSSVVLLTYLETFRVMAGVAANPSADLGMVRNPSPVLHATLVWHCCWRPRCWRSTSRGYDPIRAAQAARAATGARQRTLPPSRPRPVPPA